MHVRPLQGASGAQSFSARVPRLSRPWSCRRPLTAQAAQSGDPERRSVALPGNPWAPARWFALAGFMKIVAIAQASSYAAPFFVKGGIIGHRSLLTTVPFALGLVLTGKWLIDTKLYTRKLVILAVTAVCIAGIALSSRLSKSGPRALRANMPLLPEAGEMQAQSADDRTPDLQRPQGRRPLSTLQPRPFAGQAASQTSAEARPE
ncbi:hypothetical protein WJX84_008103 [Apatococcus fuscideae]|uniref:EamA domain-containing protein n=1 Tax=Apatococcus fuscideae TaxID=2026836 RepID=A0AAW1STW5_9CHLO